MKIDIHKKLGRFKYYLEDHAPEILSASGVVLSVVGFVETIKATWKAKDILENEHLDMKTATKIAGVYAMPVGTIVLSNASHLKSSSIYKKRYLGTAAALAATSKLVKVQQDVMNEDGIKPESIDPENEDLGYRAIFSIETAPTQFDPKDMSQNEWFLKSVERQANVYLGAKKHLFLNPLRIMLGLEEIEKGQDVGWVVGNPEGDGFVRIFYWPIIVNDKRRYMLDFNVDGSIRGKRLPKE